MTRAQDQLAYCDRIVNCYPTTIVDFVRVAHQAAAKFMSKVSTLTWVLLFLAMEWHALTSTKRICSPLIVNFIFFWIKKSTLHRHVIEKLDRPSNDMCGTAKCYISPCELPYWRQHELNFCLVQWHRSVQKRCNFTGKMFFPSAQRG